MYYTHIEEILRLFAKSVFCLTVKCAELCRFRSNYVTKTWTLFWK